VPDDAYLYILEASAGTRTDVYSFATPSGTGSLSCSQGAYDPYKNEPMTISYTITQPERVNLSIAWGANPAFAVQSGKARVPGTYTFDWDGKDTSGVIRAVGGVARCTVASLLSENHIITSGDAVQITGVKTDPYVMYLAYGQFTRIRYTLSKNAVVTIMLVAPSGATLTLEEATVKTSGAHEFTWNGLDATDATGKKILVSEEGYYVVSIQAINQSTGALTIARGSLKIGN